MKTALLVIDVQNVYTNKDSEMYCRDATKTVGRINELISVFSKRRKPIYLIRHVHKRDGSDLGRMFDFSGEAEDDFNFKDGDDEVDYDSRLARPKQSIELKKNRYSAFTGTNLKKSLDANAIERIVICGFMTNFCCESTARVAHDLDYHVDFIVDATGTPGTDNLSEVDLRKTVSETIASGIGRVMKTSKAIKEYSSSR